MISFTLFYVTTLYEIVTVPLYWRIIYVLITNPEFSAPFFQFLWIIGICENIHYVTDVIYYRMTMFELTADLFDKTPSRWLSFAPFLVYFFNYPVYFMQVAISINRFTGLWRPTKHKIFWEDWWRKIVLLAFLISFILTFHRSPLNATTQLVPFLPENPSLGYTPSIVKYEYYSLDTNLVTGIYDSLVVVLSVFINAGTLFKIIKMRKSGNLANVSKAKLEMGLFLIVVWMMCTLMAVIAYQAANFIIRNGLLSPVGAMETKYALYIIYLQQPWVDDLGSVSHPWVVILMSESIRNATLPFLKDFSLLKKSTQPVSSVVSVTNVQPVDATVGPNFNQNNRRQVRFGPTKPNDRNRTM